MSWILGIVGGFILFLYGIISTFQPSHFHRIYASIRRNLYCYGSIMIVPDTFDILGAGISLVGVIVIFYLPRHGDGEKSIWSRHYHYSLLAAITEISGGYLIWSWIRKKKTIILGLIGGLVLFIYGIIPTLQPANFGRVYAAYGGVFIFSSIIWGTLIDRKRPDKYEIVGSLIVILGER